MLRRVSLASSVAGRLLSIFQEWMRQKDLIFSHVCVK
jgi:hypothetical protein